MPKFDKLRIRIWLSSLVCALLLAGPLHPQRSSDPGLEITTQERLESEPWWPTMATAPLKAYAGSESCNQCHTEGAVSTSMRRAAQTGSDARFLKTGSSMQAAPLTYTLAETPQGLAYTVADGEHKLSQKLAWVIGAGDLARTFLYQSDGHWMQTEVSFYTRPATLDITTGLGQSSGAGLAAALGQPLSPQDARSCFNCHTVHATSSAGLEPLHAEAGLGCEACHGPAREHVSRMTTNGAAHLASAARDLASVFDPGKLSPSDSIDFCGACHRTSADAKLSTTQAFGMSAIRFQPYRLEESRCWRATRDQRLTCVACHDPHKALNRDTVSYDRQCLQCHAGSAHTPVQIPAPAAQTALVCPKASSKCVSCHMPRVTVASMHGEFTDHFIRVVRAGEPSPR